MKDRTLIYQGDPCTMCLDDPEIQTIEDVREAGARYCQHYSDRRGCSPPSYGCVQVAGLKVARYALLLYSEASEKTLAMEVAQFQERAPLPPEQVVAYIDTPATTTGKSPTPSRWSGGSKTTPEPSWTSNPVSGSSAAQRSLLPLR